MTSAARTARLPFDHILAELTAFPLASETALRHCVTHLDPAMNCPTAALWRAAEGELLAAAPSVSLDELVAMRDGCWFGAGRSSPLSLQSFLQANALTHMEYLGAGVAPRRPPQMDGPVAARPAHAQARQSWMWLTFAMPEDLLLAMASIDDWVPRPDLLTPAVRDLLARGFAETHLHVGAALDFRSVWSLMLSRLSSPGLRDNELVAPGAALREGLDLPDWLLRAAIGRIVLAGFLASDSDDHLVAYVHSGLFRTRVIREAGVVTFSVILSAITDLLQGTLSPVPRAFLQGAYAALIGGVGVRPARDLAEARSRDPVASMFGPGPGSPEQALVIRACAYLRHREELRRDDPVAAGIFWQTVRIRTMLYRHLTQRPLTPGLPWFIRFYGRMSKVRGSVSTSLLMEAAAARCGLRLGLTSLEMRTSPDEAVEDLSKWVRAAQDRQGTGAAELGLVFHFVKDRGRETALGVPRVGGAGTTADPGGNSSGYRYGDFYAGQRRAATTLARMVHRWPRAMLIVRGLDICSDELAVPSWVLKPLVDYIRQAAITGARHLIGVPGPQPRPMRMTVHAGEDFAHLLTGLRNVDETAEVLGLREGDRIGHGLALGIDPSSWANQVGRVAQPLEDRVWDLAWEWTWWTRRGRGADAARLAYIAREVPSLAERWFGCPVDALRVERLAEDLADAAQLAGAGFPDHFDHAKRPADPREWLLRRYLTHRPTFERGRQTVWVDPSGEVDALHRISNSLRTELGRRGIAIEINPTSNLLVGNLGDLENHPLWRMSSPRADSKTPRLAVTIGSDDPLVFNSSLPMEYQLLFDTLVLAGLTDAEALEWLDKVRRTGLERRFTAQIEGPVDFLSVENLAPMAPPPL